MLSKELLHKIKQIQIRSKFLASEIFAGEYESAFRGLGMEFEEVREYQPGDDVRAIDWNVTARMGNPYVKIFREERELSVVFLMDASASLDFGTRESSKRELAAELSAVLAYAAIKSNDKVGFITFTDEVEKYIPPKKGAGHVWQVIREVLTFKPKGKGSNLANALEFLSRVLPRKAVCFLISDFIAPDFEKALGIASRRHDLISLVLIDPREKKIPPLGWMLLSDLENGQQAWVNTNSYLFQKKFESQQVERLNALFNRFQLLGIDACPISADQDYVNALLRLFREREKKR